MKYGQMEFSFIEKVVNLKKFSILFFIIIFAIGYSGGEMEAKQAHYNSMNKVPSSAWDKLADQKIFFGHRSVGNNIIDGIKDLMTRKPDLKLNIIDMADGGDFKGGGFIHAKVGKNEDPQSKMDSFAEYMDKGIEDEIDISLLKFCFVDIMKTTDVNKVFTAYENMIRSQKDKHPNTLFVHITVPLIRKANIKILSRIKKFIKELLGMDTSSYFDNSHNIARNKFNELLRNKFEGKDPIFDLAKIESTYPDGQRETFEVDGKTYYALVPDYTKDAGHLHGLGRKIVAEQFLLFLINL